MVGNVADSGGAASLLASRVVIRHSLFASNRVDGGAGGALSFDADSHAELSDSLFERNRAANGGAVSVLNMARESSEPRWTRCVFRGNVASQ